MSIRFNLTRWDFVEGCLCVALQHRGFSGFIVPVSAVMGWVVADCANSPQNSVGFRVLLGVLLFFLFTALYLLGLAILLVLVALAGCGNGVLGEHTLEITDEGLIERTTFNESLHRWAGLPKVRETRRFLFIYINELFAYVHMVPKRCFASPEQARGFRSEVEKRMQAARHP